ncbi:MAG: hypothetical protein KAR64_03410, partial [Thermoplasmatales archaeon]|nr:hypothetical protein [Thermoplasmatales archaeon]
MAILLTAGLLSSTYFVIFFQESKSEKDGEEEIEENGIIDDTISPLGVNQAVSLEIRRIHKKGIENVMRKIGNS